MADTLSALEDTCRYLLGDTGASPVIDDITLDSWINMAIRDLSVYFPRTVEYTLSTTANTRAYDLETVHKAVISVEYPTGEDPPVYLKQRSYTHPDFWIEDGYYDFIKPADADSLNPPQLYISEKPPAGETITLRLHVDHDELSSGSDACTLLPRHLPLIPLFVRWKACQRFSTQEGMDPGPLTTLAFTQEINAIRAERAYRAALEGALQAESDSGLGVWRSDKFDPIY